MNGGDDVALDFGKSLIDQLLPIISEKLGRLKSSKVIIVIVSPLVALMDDQVKEGSKTQCVWHSLVCTMIEKSWSGISAFCSL